MPDMPACGKQIIEKGHAVCGVFCKRPEGHDGWCLPWASTPSSSWQAVGTTPRMVSEDGVTFREELTGQTSAPSHALSAHIAEHGGCRKQVGPCVWCADHGVRLYQGDLPDSKRVVPACAPDAHEWDMEMGAGFYSQCTICGFTEWHE